MVGIPDPRGRRTEDHSKAVQVMRLLTFTDLMAVLLSFFVLLYATRDPAPTRRIVIERPDIAPIVAPTVKPAPEAALAKPVQDLDLNYIAALLKQAQTRDRALALATIANRENAILVTLPPSDPETIRRIMAKIGTYARAMDIFAPTPIIDALMAGDKAGFTRYFPQDGNGVHIVIH